MLEMDLLRELSKINEHQRKTDKLVSKSKGVYNCSQEEKIKNILSCIGIPESLVGYKYINKAVYLCMDDSDILSNAIIDFLSLYLEVAKYYETTLAIVEKEISFAILVAILNVRNDKNIIDFLEYRYDEYANIPTNRYIILKMVRDLKNE